MISFEKGFVDIKLIRIVLASVTINKISRRLQRQASQLVWRLEAASWSCFSGVVSNTFRARYQRSLACKTGELGHWSLCGASPANGQTLIIVFLRVAYRVFPFPLRSSSPSVDGWLAYSAI